jgi:cell wall-associated NlpC family hydrolase
MQAAGSVIGHPYRWGGSSPGGFDCSGLVIWSFGHVGKSLPRSSGAQRAATKRIARHEAAAGDLVFFGSPVYHVGIYMGDGLMVHAPRAGRNVSVTSVDRMGSAPSFGRVK